MDTKQDIIQRADAAYKEMRRTQRQQVKVQIPVSPVMYAEIKLLAARKKQTVTSIVRDAIAVYLMDKAGEIYPSGSTTPRAQITDATQEVSMVAQYDNS